MNSKEYYAVIWPTSGIVVYCGDSLVTAACYLLPGSWHGKGPTPEAARRAAWKAAIEALGERSSTSGPAQGSSGLAATDGTAAGKHCVWAAGERTLSGPAAPTAGHAKAARSLDLE